MLGTKKGSHLNVRITLLIVSNLLLANCTKTRPQQWPDGVAEDIYEKSYLSTQTATVTLDSVPLQQSDALSIQAIGEVADLGVSKVDAEPRILAMFKDLHMFGRPGASYAVKFEVGTKKLTAFKELDASQLLDMPVMEQQIAKASGDRLLVPIFEFDIDAQGTVEAVKNDLGEATRTLKLTPTNADKATHVQLTTLVSMRLAVGIQPDQRESAKEVFIKTQIDGAIFSKQELAKKLQINVSEEGIYLVKLDGEQLNLFRVQKFASLSKDLQGIILESDKTNGLVTQDVRRCSDTEKSQVASDLRDGCVVVLSFQVNQITYVNAGRKVLDKDGTLSNSIDFNPANKPDQAKFIRIAKDPAVRSVDKDEQVARLDPRSTLVLADIVGEEFFLRRTMKDSPNTVTYTFAGSSGGLNIVKFIPEDKQIRVVRADALLKSDGTTSVDQETLMLLPAKYFKIVDVDEKGNRLTQPKTVSAHWSETGAIASIDWASNSIPTIDSPLDFYGVEQCFSMLSERKVSEVDHRMKANGVLNFTLTSTYAGNRGSFDCAGIEEAGYFDTVQKTFTFEERISLRKYVKAKIEKPLLSIPFDAQKVMGFGLFTYKKKQPNANGSTTVDGTEIPLASLFDLSEGKKITYVLAGLPKGTDSKSQEIRSRITQATKDVIADLNDAFRKALRGTPAERSDDVITLKLEGEVADAGQLGDLDRNHVYFVEKTTDSGIIGLGGAHANPRTGSVESASVYLYGGNMLSMVDTLRRLAKAKKDYDQMMAVTKVQNAKATSGTAVSEGPQEGGVKTVSGKLAPQSERLTQLTNGYVAALEKLKISQSVKTSSILSQSSALKLALKNKAEDWGRFQPGVLRVETTDLTRSFANLRGSQLVMAKTFNELMSQKAFRSQDKIKQILFKIQNPDRSARGMGFMAKMRAANICLYDRGDLTALISAAMSGESDLLDKKSDLEIMSDIWKATLAHEIGHNLGLRHNFEGSFDKANWKFSANEDTRRDYSSIMDYLTDDHITYAGMGPSDVAALRAAYGGVIELEPKILGAVKQDPTSGKSFIKSGAGVVTEVIGGDSVRLADYLGAVGLKTWLDLTPEATAALPLKERLFCSDEDEGTSPTCNMFDKGATPGEIVDNIIAGYRERYSLSNFANDKLVFNDNNLGGYIGRLFSQFTTVRQFLEETFYQAIVEGADGATINQYVEGAVKGLLFFNEVVRTPDAPANLDPADRFVQVQKSVPRADGSGADDLLFTIERKWIKSIASGTDVTRLKVRGIELDKTIATIMLTNREFGFPRYEQASLKLAYPDLEKLLLSDAPNAMSFPSIALLNEILHDNVAAQAATPLGAIDAPASMKAEMTELIRTYANIGAVINLDAVGLTAQDNFATAFRVLGSLSSIPVATSYVTQPGSTGDIKYYATPDALVSKDLVTHGSLLAKLRKATPALQPLMKEWLERALGINEKVPEVAAKPQTPAQRQAEIEAKINTALSKFSDDAGPKTMGEIGAVVSQVVEVSKQLDELAKQVPVSALYDEVEGLKTQLDNITKGAPNLSIAFGSISGESLSSPSYDELAPSRTAEFTENSIFRNTQLMNDLLLMVHPEYRR